MPIRLSALCQIVTAYRIEANGKRRSGNGAMFLLFEKLFVELF